MKSAEQWADMRSTDFERNESSPNEWYEDEMSFVRAIQADALRHAAQLCKHQPASLTSDGFNSGCKHCADELQAEAAKLEEAR